MRRTLVLNEYGRNDWYRLVEPGRLTRQGGGRIPGNKVMIRNRNKIDGDDDQAKSPLSVSLSVPN